MSARDGGLGPHVHPATMWAMPNVARTPSREMRRLAVRIEAAGNRFARARGSSWLETQWEAPRHAWTLSNLALRHLEATALAAKTDVVLLPAGWVTARAAVEAAGRCLWLMEPDDEWQREARWLALLYEGARLGDRPEMVGTLQAEVSARTKAFADEVKALLPGGLIVPGIPAMMSILKGQGDDLAWFYVLSSQYTHAAELATRTTRSHLGGNAKYGDRADAAEWLLPLWGAWQAFRATAVRLLAVAGDVWPPDLVVVEQQVMEAREAFLATIPPAADQG